MLCGTIHRTLKSKTRTMATQDLLDTSEVGCWVGNKVHGKGNTQRRSSLRFIRSKYLCT